MDKTRQRLGYRRIVQLLVYLVIVPTVFVLFVGIVLILVGESYNLLFGILTVALVSLMFTGIVLVLVFVNREANLSELQADFVSKVSHELRTPLTSIRLFVETMERARGDVDTEAKCVDALKRETARLSGLIERLLDWGRMEAGRKQYDIAEAKPEDIVEETVHAFSPLYDGTNLDFSASVAKDLPLIYVDRNAVVDALLNLLSNAAKYGGSPPKIDLCVERVRDRIVFSVTDNGSGIPSSEHSRIFEKFYRIDDRLSRGREGSGLGLAIVNHIANAHHAHVTVVSGEGNGSTFRLEFSIRRPKQLQVVDDTDVQKIAG